jgi:hypothetical protein
LLDELRFVPLDASMNRSYRLIHAATDIGLR